MKKITQFLLTLTLLAALTPMTMCESVVATCIEKDEEAAGFVTKSGILIDDMEILEERFERGMLVTAINYCIRPIDGELRSV